MKNCKNCNKENKYNTCRSCKRKLDPFYGITYRELKNKVYRAYGDSCNCCKESERLFLTLDHTNNDGAKHRKELSKNKSGGNRRNVYRWAVENNFPNSLQILCWNCNLGKYHNLRRNGRPNCPHKN